MKCWVDKLGYTLFNTNLWGTAIVNNQAEICCSYFHKIIQRAIEAMETMQILLIENNQTVSNIQKKLICLSFEANDLLNSSLEFAGSYLFLPEEFFGDPNGTSTPNRSRNPSRTDI